MEISKNGDLITIGKYFVLKDDLFYFWDETWSHLVGGYKTLKEAEDGMDKYCREFLGI